MKVSVLGCGRWGSFIAWYLCNRGHDVYSWGPEEDYSYKVLKETGKNEPPIAIGGGTYARALKNGCAFGPEMPGEEATIHQPNEYVTFDNLRFMTKLYYEAIKQLTE